MRATVVGGSGYVGGELLRLLLDHPHVEVAAVSSERLAGRRVDMHHPHLRGRTDLTFTASAQIEPADIAFLALPHGEAMRRSDELLALAPIVIDLSADHRLRDSDDYATWYGGVHPNPVALESFVYALPELNREQVQQSSHLATGGCTATAAILGLYPLVRAGVIDITQPLVVDAKTGSSAGGAQFGAASHHPHRSGEMRSFAPTAHRHTAELLQELTVDGASLPINMSVTSVEAVRGILVTSHLFLQNDLSERDIRQIYREAFAAEPFMRIVKQSKGLHRYPNPKLLTGTNFCDVGFERDPRTKRLVVMSAIDNLTKGAAGQAVQAMNVHCGFDERDGLGFSGLYPA